MEREAAISQIVGDIMDDICANRTFVEDCICKCISKWNDEQINNWFDENVLEE